MYVSRKKRDSRILAAGRGGESAAPTESIASETPESIEALESIETLEHLEPLVSETSPESEPLMLERDIYLEPEDEPRDNYTASSEPEDEADERNVRDEPSGGAESAAHQPPSENGDGAEVTVPDDPQDLGEDAESERESYREFLVGNSDTGVLRVQASAGGQSIPLSNVNITVYRDFSDGRHVFYQVTTNSDGVADGMLLPAPPRVNSVEGNGQTPFADYTVTASREGLRSLTVENVPIFSGVRSIQPINMSPETREV